MRAGTRQDAVAAAPRRQAAAPPAPPRRSRRYVGRRVRRIRRTCRPCGGFRPSGCPAAPIEAADRTAAGAPPRRLGAKLQPARPTDDRQSCKAARLTVASRPARRAAAPAHDPHKIAWRAPVPAATPTPTGRHSRRSEFPAPRPRTRRATRWVNSGLSIMTRTSGRAATTASAASRMRRRIFGRLAGIAAKPMIARSPSGNRLGTPSPRHMRAANAGKSRALRPPFDRGDQRGAQPVSRFLAGHQKNMRAHCPVPAGVPTTKILARSAAAPAGPARR